MKLREHPKPYRFMPDLERMEPYILDSHAMQTMKTCLRKYFFQIVTGHNPRGAQAPYFSFGSAYHKFREVMEQEWVKLGDTSKIHGKDLEDIQKKCFVIGVQAAIQYFTKATNGKNPEVGSKWDFLTQERLIQSCGAAFTHWKREKMQGKIQVLAIEQPFNVELTSDSDEYTSGRFDQIVRWNGSIWGRDWKTSSKEGMFYSRGLDPNDQFTRYTFAEQQLSGQQVKGQIIEVLYNSKKKGPEINQYLSTRTQWQLDDWKSDELFHRETLNRAREQDNWPKQETNCPFCTFHSVCKMPQLASQQSKLRAEFFQKPWDNMTVHLLEGEK